MIQNKNEISLLLQVASGLLKNGMLQLKTKIEMPMNPKQDRNRIINTNHSGKVRTTNVPASLQLLVERVNRAK